MKEIEESKGTARIEQIRALERIWTKREEEILRIETSTESSYEKLLNKYETIINSAGQDILETSAQVKFWEKVWLKLE